jgi:tartrate dehydrogenase/decarboxylase/D-malate dehydrogenase
VGCEVIPVGVRVLESALSLTNAPRMSFVELPWGSDAYLTTGSMMPEDALETLSTFDAIYLGAVGSPDIPDHITLWGLLLPIRQKFDLYVNLRPIQLFPGVVSPLRDKEPRDIDMIFVRENTEGEYAGVGGRAHAGLAQEVALQVDVFTRASVERIARYSFGLASARRRVLTSITKSNASPYTYVMWDEVLAAVSTDFPEVRLERILVDAAAARLITKPESFDVVVASNLFADILTDLAGALQGGLGLAASANVSPESSVPGLFEPVHGSAPDIAGLGIANPIGAVWAGSMMLESIGYSDAAVSVMTAIKEVLARGEVRTPDLGGSATTLDVEEALLDTLRPSTHRD